MQRTMTLLHLADLLGLIIPADESLRRDIRAADPMLDLLRKLRLRREESILVAGNCFMKVQKNTGNRYPRSQFRLVDIFWCRILSYTYQFIGTFGIL